MSYPFLAHTHRYPRRTQRRRFALRRRFGLRHLIAAALGSGLVLLVDAPAVRAEVAVNALPNPATNFVQSGSVAGNAPVTVGNTMTVNIDSQKTILNWKSLDIGRNAALHVWNPRHPGTSGQTLHRIFDNKPSEWAGAFKSDHVNYLVNQNGIIFHNGAQVNAPALVFTSFNVDERVLDGLKPQDIETPVYTWNWNRAEAEKAITSSPLPLTNTEKQSLRDAADAADQTAFETALAGGNGVVRLEPGAVIKTDNVGTVMLLAPRVENAGHIETPEGQAILAAGAKVYLDFSEDPGLRGFLVEVDPYDGKDAQGNPVKTGGVATNEKLGEIIAERGNITMAAYAVNQLGRVSATTSVRLNGSIVLKARDGATTASGTTKERIGTRVLNGADRFGELVLGEDSRTEIAPDTGSETITDTQSFNSSYVELSGKQVEIQRGAHVVATGGEIVIATGGKIILEDTGKSKRYKYDLRDLVPEGSLPDDSRIYLDNDAVLDVSGTQHVAVPMERNFVPIRLLGDELKDSPNNQEGYLYRREVWVDLRRRPPLISNIDGHIAGIGRTADERTTAGGSVKFLSRGEVILREGSNIDVSGGSLRYLDGYGRTTQLMAQGRVYDISDAPADIAYTGVAGVYTVKTRWGEREWVVPGLGSSSRYLQGYTEGKDAGKIEIVASRAVLDGRLGGTVTVGEYQRDAASMPKAPQLIIGLPDTGSTPDYRMQAMRIVRGRTQLPSGFGFETALPEAWKQELSLSNDMLRDGGFGQIGLYSNGKITLDPGVVMNLGPGGAFTANARQIAIEGGIVAPGGTVSLKTADILDTVDPSQDPVEHDLQIGTSAQILTQGLWVNDLPRIANGEFAPVFIDGGSIALDSVADLSVADVALLDVSGGAWLDATGKLEAGKGGTIGLKTGRIGRADLDPQQSKLELGGELRGYAIGEGGTLTLDTTKVQIGGERPANELHLTSDFFRRGGFRDYTVNGYDGLTVVAGTEVYPLATSLVLNSEAARTRSGPGIYSLSTQTTWPVEYRSPGKLTLMANSTTHGRLLVDTGAALRTDPLGEVNLGAGRQLTVDGTVEAPAGTIALRLALRTDGYDDDKSIWLGNGARLLAAGAVVREPNDLGLAPGEIHDGGKVSIEATGGYLVSEAGSVIDVSGTTAKLDVLPPAGSAAISRDVEIASDAGSIALSAREGMLLDGTLQGHAGNATARGGSLAITLDNQLGGSRTNFPNTESWLVVRQSGGSLPPGLRPEDSIETGGAGFVNLDLVKAGGFDALELAARHRIEFNGDAQLALNRRLVLNTQTIAASADAAVRLSAPYLAIANIDPQTNRTWGNPNALAAQPGTASFEVNGQLIDLQGDVSFDGFSKVAFTSDGDLRLRGVFDPTQNRLTASGSLTSGGDVELRADQIYPTTLTNYMLRVANNPDGTLTILPGDGASPVLSAGGRVTLSAPNIEHRGVLKAPQGEITSADSDGVVVKNVHVADGAVLSVSGEGLTVPFGSTQVEGSRWSYSYGSGSSAETVSVEQAPEKRVTLAGENVQVDGGATINLEGGGDLYAYEFTPGAPGRSQDVLAPENAGDSFAIVPWLDGLYAPYDPQYYMDVTGLRPGEGIYLAGGNGLNAGTYAILPARYALLDGAYLVTPVSGYRDLAPNTRIARHDGGEIVSGYRVSVAQNGNLRDGRESGFIVRSGAQVRGEADYGGTYASRFFDPAVNRLPRDAGRLVLAASEALSVGGRLRSDPADSGRGAEVDITANQIAIVGPNAAGIDPDFVTLDAASLTNLNAASLLFGGTRRSGEKGTEIDVTATQVVVANDAQNPLQAPEIMLVANDSVTLNDGAVVEGKGDATLSGADLVIQDDTAALVRVSSGAQVDVVRPETTSAAQGKVDIRAGAHLTAEGSMILDGSKDVINAGSLVVGDGPGTGALALGASRVSLGEAPAGTPGLVLSGANLDALSGLETLTLRASEGLDVYGGTNIGFNNLNIDAPRIAGYQNDNLTAKLSASGDIALSNKSGTSAVGSPDGTGGLRLDATDGTVRLGDGEYAIEGFSDVVIAAGREIRAEGKGSLDVASNLTLEAPRVTATTGADMTIAAASGRDGANPAWHTLTLQRPAMVPATLPAVTDLAANLALLGKNVSIGTDIELPSGIVRAEAKGADADDNVTLESGANIKAGGAERAFADVFAYAPGGKVVLASENGDVTIAAGAEVDVAGVGAGDGGRLEIAAHNGMVSLDGTFHGGAGPRAGDDAQSGSFRLDVSTLDDGDLATTDEFSKLNTKLNDGGFTESREIRVGSGDIDIGVDDVVRAQEFTLVADGGAIDVAGRIDASGYDGGRVKLVSRDDLTIKPGASIDASASGPDQNGGRVDLESSTGGILLETQNDPTKTSINVNGPAGGGKVNLRLLRSAVTTLTDSNPANHKLSLAGGIEGASRVTVEGVERYAETDGILDANDVSATVAGSVGEQRYNEAVAFMQNEVAVRAALGRSSDTDFHLVPGIEINSVSNATNPNGDLTVTADWDLAGWRFNSTLRNPDGSELNRPEVGVLTIRSAGDLNINGSISDGFSNATTNGKLFADGDSWSHRFVAGADLGSAYTSALNRNGMGDFRLAADKLIRTGTGFIDVAAAGDIALTNQKSVIYTAGHDAESVADFTAPSTTAYYPVDGGDLRLVAGRNIFAETSNQLVTDWLYRQGSVSMDGMIQKNPTWYLVFDKFEQGIGALGGGRVSIEAGKDIRELSVVVPTSGRLPGASGSAADESRLQVFGGGELAVRAGGDITSGLYYVGRGDAKISADGSIVSGHDIALTNDTNNVTGHQALRTLFALGDASLVVRARGVLDVESVFNPTLFTQAPLNLGKSSPAAQPKSYFFTYGENSAVDFTSVGGDVLLQNGLNQNALKDLTGAWRGITGVAPPNQINTFQKNYLTLLGNDSSVFNFYPSSLRITALESDIVVNMPSLNLYPASKGTLELLAQGDIDLSKVTVQLLDVHPTSLPGVANPSSANSNKDLINNVFGWSGAQVHSNPVLHQDDIDPARIVASTGDILGNVSSSALRLAKPAVIVAGRDIRDLWFDGQNLRPEDVTRIEAGRDIFFTITGSGANVQASKAEITLGGPGRLEVLAGRDVDLGSSVGIRTRGNLDNPYLPEGGTDILVQAGVAGIVDRTDFIDRYLADTGSMYGTELRDYMRLITGDTSLDEATALAEFRKLPAAEQTPLLNTVFFSELRESGKEATDVKSQRFGDYSLGIEAVRLMYPGSDGGDSSPYQGDIKLFFSQIKTEQGGGIDLITPGGTVNAGLAASSGLDKGDSGPGDDASHLGIVTAAGGVIRGYVLKDFLVNQSRVFTLQGGDILLWATKGDIDAGRGARVASATPPPSLRVTGNGQVVLDLTQSVAGSGIGALRANPDVPKSNVYLFAPEGTVNAGEAGIRVSGNLTIGAQQVLGADVIQAGGVSVGVPADSGSAAAGLAGVADSAASTSKSAESAATDGRQDDDSQLVLDVEVVSYGGDTKGTELRIKKDDKEKSDRDENDKE